VTLDRELTPFEQEVRATMAARRAAALRLRDALDQDVSGYDDGLALIDAGRSMEILAPPAAGAIRQHMSDAINEFEGARHQFRLALVAVAADNGLTARQIGDAFSFSRQLASRYLKEAHARWPALEAAGCSEELTGTAAGSRFDD